MPKNASQKHKNTRFWAKTVKKIQFLQQFAVKDAVLF